MFLEKYVRMIKTLDALVEEQTILFAESNKKCKEEIDSSSTAEEIQSAVEAATNRGRVILLYILEKKKEAMKIASFESEELIKELIKVTY